MLKNATSFAPSLETAGETNSIVDRRFDVVRMSQYSDLGIGLNDRLEGFT
jgi:hypothetical protein